MSLIFATQLTAVATVALAVLALATAVLAYLAWRKQSREVRDQAEMLRLQAEEFSQLSEDRKREALERRRDQAVHVYMWVAQDDKGKSVIHVRNTSQRPVYDVVLREADPPAFSVMEWLQPLMPGQEYTKIPTVLPHWPGDSWTCSATFCDHAGVRWQMWPGGRLEEIPESPELTELTEPDNSAPAPEIAPDVGQ